MVGRKSALIGVYFGCAWIKSNQGISKSNKGEASQKIKGSEELNISGLDKHKSKEGACWNGTEV